MEKRKLQKVGHSTLSVSLPKKWINLTGVNRGDIVYLDQNEDGTLRIFSEAVLEKGKEPVHYDINCDLIREPNLLERLIVGSYVQGVDMIKIFSSTRIDSKQREETRNISRRLIGISIMEESRKEMILQSAIDPSKIGVFPLLERLSVIASTMIKEAMEALQEFNTEFANDVIIREGEANNVYWLITRLIHTTQKSQTLAETISLKAPISRVGIRLVSRSLERIADCAENIAKIALQLHEIRDTIDKEELNKISLLGKMTKDVYQKAIDSLFMRNVINANDALNLRDKLDAEVESRMHTVAIPYFRAIPIMLAMIAENSATIAFEVINSEIKKRDNFLLQEAAHANSTQN